MTYPDPTRSRAVVVGTARYDVDTLPGLPAVPNNVTGITTALCSPQALRLPAGNCTSVVDPQRPDDFFEPLKEAADQAEELLLLYYTGHGLLEGDDGDLYLALRSTRRGKTWTSAAFDVVAELIRESAARTKVLVLDCCFSGRALRTHMAAADASPVERADISGTYVLTSSSQSAPSLAPEGEPYTTFTGELLKILANGLPDVPLPDLTFVSIYEELRRRFRARAVPLPQQRNVNNAANLLIARNNAFGSANSFSATYYRSTFIEQYENFDQVRAAGTPRIVEALARDNLCKVYVSQECVDPEGDVVDLGDYVDDWLDREGRGSLVILGEYGYGKTSYCLNLTYRLLKAWRQDDVQAYFPVFLSFRDIVSAEDAASARDSESRIVEILLHRFRLIRESVDFPSAIAGRRLLLVLDGLDEIEKSLDITWIRRQFQTTADVTRYFEKIIVTCRISYLSNEDDVRRVMSSDQYDLIVGSVALGTDPDIVTLQPFDDEQKARYIELSVDDRQQRLRLQQAISTTRDLPDLTTRPVLLWMVVSAFRNHLVDLQDAGRLTAAELYDRFTRNWLEGELDKDHIGRDVLENQELMHRLAARIYDDPAEQIHRRDLLRELKISFPGRSRSEIARLEHEFLVCSFFRPSQLDHFSFVHRSFLEFFVAKAYLSYIDEDRPEAFGRQRLRPGLVPRFLAQLLRAGNLRSATERLVGWMRSARTLAQPGSRLAANAATILCHLCHPFRGLSLPGVDLRDADLSGGDLRYVQLRGAKLDNAVLFRTKLSHSDLSDADMCNVFIQETEFTGADLQGARIKNPRLIGGPDTIWIALFSRDRRHIVVGTDRGTLIVLENTAEHRVATTVFVHESGVMNIAFDARGSRLAVSNRRREIYLYDWPAILAGGDLEPVVFADNANYIRWLEFSPVDARLASGARDLLVKIWYYGDDPQVTSLRFHARDIMCVTWSMDGRWLASGGYDATIALWDTAEDRLTALELRDWGLPARPPDDPSIEERSHRGTIRSLVFSPSGSWLASSSEDHTIKVWDLSDATCPLVDLTIQTEHEVFCLVFVDAGAALVAGDSAGNLLKVDLEQREVIRTVAAHGSRVRSLDLDLARGVLLSSSWDGSVKKWHVGDLSPIGTVFQLDAGDVSYTPRNAFVDTNIGGVLDLEAQFREYFLRLGAVEHRTVDTRSAVDGSEETPMTTAPEAAANEGVFHIDDLVRPEVLRDAIRDTVAQPWYEDVFCRSEPGRVPDSFGLRGLLTSVGMVADDGTALYRPNLLWGRAFVTDGYWHRNGVYSFTDESDLLLQYCAKNNITAYDELVDPGAGCGHTAIAFPGSLARTAFDIDARAVEFARLSAWLNDCELRAERNDITRGLPDDLRPDGRRVLFVANMPFAISPYAGALSHVRDGGENGIRLSVSVLEAVRPFVGTGSRLVILTYSLGRDNGASWQFVEQARQVLPRCELRWELTDGRIWRVGSEKVEPNPMPLSALKLKSGGSQRSRDEQRRLREGYDKLAKELQSLGWDRLGCGILDVVL